MALSKQGMKSQFLNTEPEEWDTPAVVEMLTRTRVSEVRRPASTTGTKKNLKKKCSQKQIHSSSRY